MLRVLADTGSYTISVTASGYNAVSGINVRLAGGETTPLLLNCVRRGLVGITIQPENAKMAYNDTRQLTIYGVYADSARVSGTANAPTIWVSRSPDMVTVNGNGFLSSYTQAGTCVIVANVPSMGLSDSIEVLVVPAYREPLYAWKLDETNGMAAFDATGNGNNGILKGSPAWSSGRYGNALDFDGIDDYMTTTLKRLGLQVFSISLWFKTVSTTGGCLIGFGDSQAGTNSDQDRKIVISETGQLIFNVQISVWDAPYADYSISTTKSYNDGQWHQAAATLSGSGMALYVDGVLCASDPEIMRAKVFTGYWQMGFVNTPYFKGQLDDIRIYNRALPALDIGLMYTDSSMSNLAVIDTTVIKEVLSTGCAVTASSSLEYDTWGKRSLTDGTTENQYSSDCAVMSGDEWVEIDLGQDKLLSRVGLIPLQDSYTPDGNSWAFPVDFTITAKTSEGAQTTVVTKTNYANPYNGAPQEFNFTPLTARYVRLLVTKFGVPPGGECRFQLAEMEIINMNKTSVETFPLSPLFFGLASAPNPFSAVTLVKFNVPQSKNGEKQKVSVRIYDLNGKLVQTLAKGNLAAGYHTAAFNGRENGHGQKLGNGIYFCRMQAPGYSRTLKLLLVE